jgi:hypothetical protein
MKPFLTITPTPGLKSTDTDSFRIGATTNSLLHEEYKIQKVNQIAYLNVYYGLTDDRVDILANFEDDLDFLREIHSLEQWHYVCKILPTCCWLIGNTALKNRREGILTRTEDIEDSKTKEFIRVAVELKSSAQFKDINDFMDNPEVTEASERLYLRGCQVIAELVDMRKTMLTVLWEEMKSGLTEGFILGLRRGIKNLISDDVADLLSIIR